MVCVESSAKYLARPGSGSLGRIRVRLSLLAPRSSRVSATVRVRVRVRG